MVSFYAFPEIFIDTVTALTTCFEHIFFKRVGVTVRTPWTPPGSATGDIDADLLSMLYKQAESLQEIHNESN